MAENYEHAALRHFDDAEHLAGSQRFDNAGHLIGFATECAIKHHFRITTGSDTPKTHLPDLAASMRRRFSARDPNQAAMNQLLVGCGSTFFADWDVGARYGDSGSVTEAQYSKWKHYARRTFGAARLRAAKSGGGNAV